MIWFNKPHDLSTFTPAWAFLVSLVPFLSGGDPHHLQLIGLPHGSSSVYCLLRRVSLCLRIDASWSRCFQRFEGNSTRRPKSNWCPTRWLRFSRHVMQFTCSIAPLIRLSKRTRLLHDVFLHLHLCYPVSCPKHRF